MTQEFLVGLLYGYGATLISMGIWILIGSRRKN